MSKLQADEMVKAFRVAEGKPPVVTPGIEGRITRDLGWFTRRMLPNGDLPYQDALIFMVKTGVLELSRVPASEVTVLEDGAKLAEPKKDAPFVNLEGMIESASGAKSLGEGFVKVLDESGNPVEEPKAPSLPGFGE